MDDNGNELFPLARPRSLREACRQVGLDRYGERCPDCPLRYLCEDDGRWLVSYPDTATRQ